MRSSENAISRVPAVLDLASEGYELNLPPLDWLYAGASCGAAPTGVKALMLAVLEEAMRNFLGRNGAWHDDAAFWMGTTRRESPFAFRTVCETLGLEPSAVRRALYRLRERNVSAREAGGRLRPNVSRKARRLTSVG